MTAVIVGSSVGGVRTAQALRYGGYDSRVVVVGEELDIPYDKPPMSKGLLAGALDIDEVRLLTAEDAAASGVELRLGAAATGLDPDRREVQLQDGERIGYEHLVIATGARARPSPWGLRPGVHVLRTMRDCLGIRDDLRAGGSLVVIGGGFIGSEVAATARGLGLEVTIVDPVAVPMARLVGTEVGALLVALHEEHLVGTRLGVAVESVTGRRGALRVGLSDGSQLAASTVVVGVGALPNDGWLEGSGVAIDGGVLCDRYCRATAPDVYAVGDVARWFHRAHGRHVRVEHWTNAVEQATCVAHNILHPDTPIPYEPIEYVWSDVYDRNIRIIGNPAGASDHVIVRDPGDPRRLAALYTDDGERLSGALTINWPRALVECRRHVRGARTIDVVAGHLRELLGVSPVTGGRRSAGSAG